MPRVSVVMPAYDAEAVVADSIGSVLAQTYGDWELIVGDDASSDATVERAQAASPRVRIARAERNGGPAAARNRALEQASGELVAFLDADDWWLPDYLERQVARYDAETAAGGPPVGLVACDARIRLPDGSDAAGTYADQFRDRGASPTLERLLRRNFIYVSALVPRAAGEEVGWFDAGLFGTEDHDLWIKLLERGRRAVVNDRVLCVYRRTEGSISLDLRRQAANNQLTYLRALDRGNLTPGQQRIARSELRYNRAMGAVAEAAFGGEPPLRKAVALARTAGPLLAVTATRPRQWGDWLRVLRGGA
jgi:glycosyltransferase involved in cell wall biosynthesis